MRDGMERDWGDFTRKALELAKISQNELARILTKKLGREITQGAVHSRLSNPQGLPPPEDEIDHWADALHLDGFHRDTFIRLAMMRRTPLKVQNMLYETEDRVQRNEKRIKSLERESAELKNTVSKLTIELAEATKKVADLLQRLPGRC